MARIRSVKPELRRDLTVAEWPRDCRYAWVLLWGYLDDHGRGLDDLRLLTADLFPLDRDVTEKKLDGWLNLMAKDSTHGAAPLCRYTVDGRRLLHAPKWKRSQRVSHPQESQIPACPVHEQDRKASGTTRRSDPPDSGTIPESFPNDSAPPPEPFATSRAPEGQGVKGAREQGGSSSLREAADETQGQRANRLTKTYTDRVPMSAFLAVQGVVLKAIKAGKTDDEITAALVRLADDGRSVTANTLRIEIEGQPKTAAVGHSRVAPPGTHPHLAHLYEQS